MTTPPPTQLPPHPALWTGSQLPEKPDWIRDIPPLDTNPLDTPNRPNLPAFLAFLASIQHDLEHGSGATLLRGFPTNLPEAEAADHFLALCQHIGTPISQSADGHLVFSVRDAGHAENDPRNRGPNTKKKLTFHADRCDVIAFLCLQPAASGGENDIVSSMLLYNEISRQRPDLLAQLLQPFYYKRHTVDLANDRPWCRQPIFSFTDGHFACNLLRVLIDRAAAMDELPDLTPQQTEALDLVQTIAEHPANHHRFRLARGDILFLNNWVTLHRRTAFTDAQDPTQKRHILRVWLSVPNSRPLDPHFKDNYGAVKAGAIRGGMQSG